MARRRSPIRLLALGVVWAALALLALFICLVALYAFARPVSTLMLARTVEGKSYQRDLHAAQDHRAGRARRGDRIGRRELLRQ